jgi:V/A-type H+-transporting ATPase subunit D
MGGWVKLFAEPFPWEEHLRVVEIRQGEGNIAGVNIPVFDGVDFDRTLPDPADSAVWVDDGLRALEQLITLRLERRVIEEQYRLLGEELRTTNQRVNLFEKVKIPEAKENIRVIRIFLGDQQTAGVARSKIAKGKSVAKATMEMAL